MAAGEPLYRYVRHMPQRYIRGEGSWRATHSHAGEDGREFLDQVRVLLQRSLRMLPTPLQDYVACLCTCSGGCVCNVIVDSSIDRMQYRLCVAGAAQSKIIDPWSWAKPLGCPLPVRINSFNSQCMSAAGLTSPSQAGRPPFANPHRVTSHFGTAHALPLHPPAPRGGPLGGILYRE
jgi:hypothetical protein